MYEWCSWPKNILISYTFPRFFHILSVHKCRLYRERKYLYFALNFDYHLNPADQQSILIGTIHHLQRDFLINRLREFSVQICGWYRTWRSRISTRLHTAKPEAVNCFLGAFKLHFIIQMYSKILDRVACALSVK